MKNYSVLIIDDDPDQAHYLEGLLLKIPIFLTIKIVNDPTQGFSELLNKQYDLVFMDVEMPTLSGLEIIKTMNLPPTIVITSHPGYAAECFDLDNVVDFIEKPVSLTRLGRAIRRAQQSGTDQKQVKTIYFKAGHRNHQFNLDDILYIEADGIYSKIYTKSGDKSLVNSNISEIEKQLEHTQLLRLHKSYIYNCAYITSFDSRNLWIGNQKFTLGVNYRGRLGEYLNVDTNF